MHQNATQIQDISFLSALGFETTAESLEKETVSKVESFL